MELTIPSKYFKDDSEQQTNVERKHSKPKQKPTDELKKYPKRIRDPVNRYRTT